MFLPRPRWTKFSSLRHAIKSVCFVFKPVHLIGLVPISGWRLGIFFEVIVHLWSVSTATYVDACRIILVFVAVRFPSMLFHNSTQATQFTPWDSRCARGWIGRPSDAATTTTTCFDSNRARHLLLISDSLTIMNFQMSECPTLPAHSLSHCSVFPMASWPASDSRAAWAALSWSPLLRNADFMQSELKFSTQSMLLEKPASERGSRMTPSMTWGHRISPIRCRWPAEGCVDDYRPRHQVQLPCKKPSRRI